MYLHLGQSSVVRESTVIGIFDLDNCGSSKITKEFLRNAERDGRLTYVADDIPKAFVVTRERGETRVWMTLLGSQTLFRRAAGGDFI